MPSLSGVKALNQGAQTVFLEDYNEVATYTLIELQLKGALKKTKSIDSTALITKIKLINDDGNLENCTSRKGSIAIQ